MEPDPRRQHARQPRGAADVGPASDAHDSLRSEKPSNAVEPRKNTPETLNSTRKARHPPNIPPSKTNRRCCAKNPLAGEMSEGQRGICDSTKQKPTPKRVLQWSLRRVTEGRTDIGLECPGIACVRATTRDAPMFLRDSQQFDELCTHPVGATLVVAQPWGQKGGVAPSPFGAKGDASKRSELAGACGGACHAFRRSGFAMTPSVETIAQPTSFRRKPGSRGAVQRGRAYVFARLSPI